MSMSMNVNIGWESCLGTMTSDGDWQSSGPVAFSQPYDLGGKSHGMDGRKKEDRV